MSKKIKRLALYLLALVPVASISFAAKSALNMDLNKIKLSSLDQGQIPHGAGESSRAG